jgi:hypothetical protein
MFTKLSKVLLAVLALSMLVAASPSIYNKGVAAFGRITSTQAPDNGAAFIGTGTATLPFTNDTADTNFMEMRFDNGASTGTSRGQYLKLYLTGGAGGEAARFYTSNTAAAPVDTVNGAHISLDHTGSGNVTGLGTAVRATYHVPSKTLTGTNAAVNAELWADGASSTASNIALFRGSIGGDATGKAALETAGYLMDLDLATQSGGIFDSQSSWSVSKVLKIKIGGVVYYLPLSTAK